MDFMQAADGAWWAVMLAVRPQGNGLAHLGRETWLAPVDWEAGGWPIVNKGQLISTRIPAKLPPKLDTVSWRDDFDEGDLLSWFHTASDHFSLQKQAHCHSAGTTCGHH